MALFPKYSKTREGQNVIMEQRLLKAVNNLILNAETCTGCGICVDACPEEAIALGPVGATRRGAIDYAEPIDVNPEKCSYCGVCVIMCPFNALTLKIDGEERLPILEQEGFPTYDMVTVIDEEKCNRCTICDDVCPRDAINRDVPAFEGGDEAGRPRQTALQTKTTFTVDTEKCDVCGICGELCPSITVARKPANPETGTIEGDVLWEESTCDGMQDLRRGLPPGCNHRRAGSHQHPAARQGRDRAGQLLHLHMVCPVLPHRGDHRREDLRGRHRDQPREVPRRLLDLC